MVLFVTQAQDRLGGHGENGVGNDGTKRFGATVYGEDFADADVCCSRCEGVTVDDGNLGAMGGIWTCVICARVRGDNCTFAVVCHGICGCRRTQIS